MIKSGEPSVHRTAHPIGQRAPEQSGGVGVFIASDVRAAARSKICLFSSRTFWANSHIFRLSSATRTASSRVRRARSRTVRARARVICTRDEAPTMIVLIYQPAIHWIAQPAHHKLAVGHLDGQRRLEPSHSTLHTRAR